MNFSHPKLIARILKHRLRLAFSLRIIIMLGLLDGRRGHRDNHGDAQGAAVSAYPCLRLGVCSCNGGCCWRRWRVLRASSVV